MLKKGLALGVVFSFVVSTVSMAAPVRFPSSAGKTQAILSDDGSVVLGIGVEYELVDEVEFDALSIIAEFDTVSVIPAITFNESIMLYGTIGQIMDPVVKYTNASGSAILDLDDELIWGIGLAGKIALDETLELFGDISYRETDDMAFKSLTVNGTSYVLTTGSSIYGKIEELQVAAGVSLNMENFKPFVGVVCSDTEYSATVAATGYTTAVVSAEKDNTVGVVLGLSATPVEGLELALQGRFVDETAVSGSVTFRF